jgi:hypothetical protein
MATGNPSTVGAVDPTGAAGVGGSGALVFAPLHAQRIARIKQTSKRDMTHTLHLLTLPDWHSAESFQKGRSA